MDPRKFTTAATTVADDGCSRRGTPTGLRGLTASPRMSLSLMRSRRDSYETTSSGSSSCATDSSCVTRQTSPDDCDRHRFIVWTAVLRNNCDKMSSADRLECPMLRCRRRCASHEDLLKHLYDCKLLSTGEYWCYECERSEMFTDSTCKRCTGSAGHAGRRRRIMNHAKSFLSSVRHRSKKDAPSTSSHTDDDTLFDVPNFTTEDSCRKGAELSSSTEILEIDSIELMAPPLHQPQVHGKHISDDSAPTLLRDEYFTTRPDMFGAADDHQPISVQVSPFPTLSSAAEQLLDWDANYPPAGPEDPIRIPSPASFQERPLLQLSTTALGHLPSQPQDNSMSQNNQLSHSLSLRSNGSTATSNSYGISPASVHSGAWTMGDAWDTDMTSLSSGVASPTGYLSRGGSNASRRTCFDLVQHPETIAELPADTDMSAMGYASTQPSIAPMDLVQALQDVEGSISRTTVEDMPEVQPQAQTEVQALTLDAGCSHTNTRTHQGKDVGTLVSQVWAVLQHDLAVSTAKRQAYTSNPLLAHLDTLGSQGVHGKGVVTLRALLDGHIEASQEDFLCCVLLLRAMSTTASRRYDSTSSSSLLPTSLCLETLSPNTDAYLTEALQVMQAPTSLPPGYLPQPAGIPAKSTEKTVSLQPLEPLLGSASHYLDALELAALSSKPSTPAIAMTSLWAQHQALHLERQMCPDSKAPLLERATMLQTLLPTFGNMKPRLQHVVERIENGEINHARRAELELIHAGEGCFPPNNYLDTYVPTVRHICDTLYNDAGGEPSRRRFQQATAALYGELSQNLLPVSGLPSASTLEGPGLGSFATSITGAETDSLLFDEFLTLDDSTDLGSLMAIDVPHPNPAVPRQPDGSSKPAAMPNPDEAKESWESSAAGGGQKVEAKESCKLCGFRPKGDPKWFRGSMAKHMKHQHSTNPPTIFKCPFPNCKSEYKNRPDNLRQHQIEKGHFVGGETGRRPSKRKKMDHPGDD